MTDLLTALSWKASAGNGIRLIATVLALTLFALVSVAAIASVAGVSVIVLQCAIWGLWLAWLGIVFPRNRRRDESAPCPYPYRRAFRREILFGIGVAFSQLLRPAVSGVLSDGYELGLTPYVALGLPVLVAGAGVICLGVSTLGVARTLFVYEYVPTDSPVMTTGIFRILRHPLFLGGSLASLGLAICTGAQVAIELAILNGCVVPMYVWLEDRRCCATLGQAYVDYRAVVGGVIPRRRSLISQSALAHQTPGSIGPSAPRDLARTL